MLSRLVKYFFLFITVAFFSFLDPGKSVVEDVIQLGNRREVFVDNYLIDKMKDARIVLHTPHNEGPVLKYDKPWEGSFSAYVTIIKDGDLYQAYYRGNPTATKDGSITEVTCYAESKDGINWNKPDLKIYTVDGTKNNNVVLANEPPFSHNFSPFVDANPNVKSGQKYKALAGIDKSGLIAYVSPDGIHWKRLQQKAVFTKGVFDSQNVAFWSESEKQYVCYFRTWSEGGFTQYKGFRSVSRTTSKDFINWTEPVAMTFGNTPYEHLYTQQTSSYFRAPHIYIAIGARFMPDRQVVSDEQAKKLDVNPKYYKDCSDGIFMSSRGGNQYDRTFMESFIRPGIGLENWVSRSNYPALNVVQTGPAEMSIYVNENYAQPTANLKRYSLRLDGFTSINAPYKGGEVLTKPFTFTGQELEINYSTSAAGEIRIEIQDERGNPVPGYTMEDAQIIIGNEIKRIVSWKGNENVKALSSKKIRLRIFIKDADLYSLKFN